HDFEEQIARLLARERERRESARSLGERRPRRGRGVLRERSGHRGTRGPFIAEKELSSKELLGSSYHGSENAPTAGIERSPERDVDLGIEGLDEDRDPAAAGEADFPGLLVGDAEVQKPRDARARDLDTGFPDRPFHASPRDRA